jgi:hypothetical protein
MRFLAEYSGRLLGGQEANDALGNEDLRFIGQLVVRARDLNER